MTTPDINELLMRARKTFKDFEEIRVKWNLRQYELQKQAKNQLQSELGEDYKKIQNEYLTAQNEWKAEKDRLAEQSGMKGLPFPEGTKMNEWKRREVYDGFKRKRFTELSGRKGVLQVFRKGDDFPRNMKWGIPCPGQTIIRLLKADGSPGTKIERYNSLNWIPEGQTNHPDNQETEEVQCN